ncbi:hypothetical protein [Lachnotalea glycerini]|uniref:Uncharacterized protein n=1 Tax=Lachnotalea glycerini TaxID=1763509 RepID=A0A371JBK4_9FIRM|nr:hypothetical protein [Lachnotalea glycerini]RDY30140.1 hypothetical protein CG710_016290 [Lachnotalea glycerini]
MQKTMPLVEVEDYVSEMDTLAVEDTVLDTNEESMLVVSGWWIRIPSLNLYVREGIVCIFDETEKDYLPDFSVTVIMESELIEDGWIYFEQDKIIISLASYMNGKMELSDLEELECVLCVPEENIER